MSGGGARNTLAQLRAEIMARAAYTLVAEAGAQQQRQSSAAAGSSSA